MTDLDTFRTWCATMATAEHRPECCRCGHVWCCGCLDHPAGKPWGWAMQRWEEHAETCPGNPSAPACPGCVTDADRAPFAALAAEIDAYRAAGPDVVTTAPTDVALFGAEED